jgi:glutamine---fructose-6-phosphate transaminase (isomerizing)
VLAAARLQGRPTIALTNDESSPLALAADQVVPLETGPERSVAATKTYLSSLYAIEQIIQHLRPDDDRGRWLDRLPELVDRMVAEQLRRRADFEVLESVGTLTVVGRGLDFSAAHETALKIRELSGIPAEPFSPADLLHGPIAALRDDGGLWVVDTHRELDPAVVELLDRMRDRDLRKVLVSRQLPAAAADALHIPVPEGLPDWAATILAVMPGQVAALALASSREGNIDAPHGLSKITLTR